MPLADHLFPIVLTARDAAQLVGPVLDGLCREKLAVLHLDGDRRLLGLIESDVDAEAKLALPFRAIVSDALRFNSLGSCWRTITRAAIRRRAQPTWMRRAGSPC